MTGYADYTVGPPVEDDAAPGGSIDTRWERHRFGVKLVNPANKRKMKVIVVGTGLAGGSAAATLGELGYQVSSFCFQDSPRRAHSIAAQGGINAAKNYRNDGDSVFRLFYDTIKGGDFRARESNVHRLAEISRQIIDQCVAQGVPFAREYGGLLDTRSFGGAQVSRTFYARGQTGQQLLLGAYQALERQIRAGTVTMYNRHEMLELIVVDGRARGIVARDLVTGQTRSHLADAVVLASGGYGNVFYLSTNAKGCNVTASWRAHRKGALFANPCYTQIHPTCIPVSGEHQSKLTLMSESLRNDGRVWVPKERGDDRTPAAHPRRAARLLPGAPVPGVRQPGPARHRQPRREGRVRRQAWGRPDGSGRLPRLLRRDQPAGPGGRGGEVREPVRHVRAHHRREPVRGSDAHLPGRALHDGRAVGRLRPAEPPSPGCSWPVRPTSPTTARTGWAPRRSCRAWPTGTSCCPPPSATTSPARNSPRCPTTHRRSREAEAEVAARVDRLLSIDGTRTVDSFHRELGQLMWDYCGMERSDEGLRKALDRIPELRREFWNNVKVPGSAATLNQSLEKAGRVADFLELGELMCLDALHRTESCGGHFRAESQTEEGEARRDDENFSYVAAWEYTGQGQAPVLHKEDLVFEYVTPSQRSYK